MASNPRPNRLGDHPPKIRRTPARPFVALSTRFSYYARHSLPNSAPKRDCDVLIQFAVANYRSIKNEATLSLRDSHRQFDDAPGFYLSTPSTP